MAATDSNNLYNQSQPSLTGSATQLFPLLSDPLKPKQDGSSGGFAPDGTEAMNAATAHAHHLPQRTQSCIVAMLHIICITAGVGVLNLPRVVADGGWLTICLFPIVSFITDYTSRLIVKSLYLVPPGFYDADSPQDSASSLSPSVSVSASASSPRSEEESTAASSVSTLSRPRMRNFADVGRAAFGKPGFYLVHVFQKMVLLGICVVFLILAGNCMQQLFADIVNITEWQWILIISALLAVPVIFLKSMEEVVWTSAIGFSATVFLVIVTIILCIMEIQKGHYGESYGVQYNLVVWSHVPLSLAGICFAYCGNYVYPSIEETMARPKLFGRTVSFSLLLITCMYIPVAVLAYLVYGSSVQSPVLRSFPNNGWTIALLIFIAGHVLATLPLPLVTLIMEAERKLGLGPHANKDESDTASSLPLAEQIAQDKAAALSDDHNDGLQKDENDNPDWNNKSVEQEDLDSIEQFKQRQAMSDESPLPKVSLFRRIVLAQADALLRLGFLGVISLIACLFYGSFTDIMDFFGAVSNSSFLFFFPVIFYIKLKGWRNVPKLELVGGAFIVLLGILTTVVGGYQAGKNLFTSFKAPFT